jgi:hypothetical protein
MILDHMILDHMILDYMILHNYGAHDHPNLPAWLNTRPRFHLHSI